MRAVQVTTLEGPDAVRVAEVAEPEAQDRVLIGVATAGVSFPDLLLSRGLYQLKPPLPFVPGVEVAGTVRSAPSGSGFGPGDQVMAFTMLGGFAEVAAADAALTLPIPRTLNLEQAGGFLMNHHTAHFALARRGRLRPGEWLAVHGAAGGLGLAAVQVGRGLGAHVAAVTSTPEKADAARQAGADLAVLTTGDWASELRQLDGGRGPSVIFDPVGGDRFDASVRCLAPEGRLLVVGFTEGRIPAVQVNRLLLRNIEVVGVAWGAFLAVEPGLFQSAQHELDRMLTEGTVVPQVGHVFPLDEAGAALRTLEERRATGKVVLRVG